MVSSRRERLREVFRDMRERRIGKEVRSVEAGVALQAAGGVRNGGGELNRSWCRAAERGRKASRSGTLYTNGIGAALRKEWGLLRK